MNMDHNQLERLAIELCESRMGKGHYYAKGTKRAHWRKLAGAVERQRGISTLDALMGIFGFRRAK